MCSDKLPQVSQSIKLQQNKEQVCFKVMLLTAVEKEINKPTHQQNVILNVEKTENWRKVSCTYLLIWWEEWKNKQKTQNPHNNNQQKQNKNPTFFNVSPLLSQQELLTGNSVLEKNLSFQLLSLQSKSKSRPCRDLKKSKLYHFYFFLKESEILIIFLSQCR